MKKKILIIDDDANIISLLTLFLQRNGSDVLSGQSAEKGLAFIRKQDFDLILLDIMLPDASGLDVLKRIKKIVPHVPVIMITGGCDLEIARKSLSEGAVDYITKPFDLDYLHTTVIANMLGA